MKHNKFVSMLAIGTLFGPTLLASQQVLAEEIEPAASSATTAPAVEATTPSTESTEEAGTTESTGSTEVPGTTDSNNNVDDNTSVPDVPDQKEERGLVSFNQTVLRDLGENTFMDSNNNKIVFEYTATDLVKDTQIHYTVTPATGFKLKEVKLTNAATPVMTSLTGDFKMPDSDVVVELVMEKEQSKEDIPDQTDTNNNQNGSNSNNQVPVNKPTEKPATSKPAPSAPSKTVDNSTSAKQNQTAATAKEPASSTGDVRVPSNQSLPTFSNEVQTAIVQEAYRHLGKPYVWGAKGPNAFDCSGLAYAVYANATGHYIGGWTGDQQYAGTQIPVSEAQPGDLLFWGAPTSVTTHVAIYIGNGQYIHAPQPGDVVKIGSISSFAPTFAVRVNIAGLPKASSSLANAFDQYSPNQPFIFNKNQTTDQFIKKIGEFAREIGQKNELYSSVMIAQAILESGSGNSALASEPNYNLFGIKGKYEGQGVSFKTLEQDQAGDNYQITAEFRKYPSYKESLEDYAKLIKEGVSGNSEFYKGTWKNQTKSYEDATKYLQGRYATDKQYAEKLNAIIKAYDLTEFDQEKSAKVKTTTGPKIEATKSATSAYDQIQLKLIASIANSSRVPQIMSAKQFVNLFKAESLIALAATKKPTKKATTKIIPTTASIYVSLSNGLLAILPPMK